MDGQPSVQKDPNRPHVISMCAREGLKKGMCAYVSKAVGILPAQVAFVGDNEQGQAWA